MLKKDKKVLEPATGVETDDNDKPIQEFNQDKNFELAKALEDAYLTPPQSDKEEEDLPCAFHIKYPFDQAAEDGGERDPEIELDSMRAVKLDLILAVKLDLTLVGWAAWQEPLQTLFQPQPKLMELELVFNGQDIGQEYNHTIEDVSKDDCVIKELFRRAQEDQFINFIPEKITSIFYRAFLAGRKFKDIKLYKKNLPLLLQSIRDLKTHPFQKQFMETQ